jgi:hypothetical protein
MTDEREVEANGEVEEIKKVSCNEIFERLKPKCKRYVDNRFIYRVFVRKERRLITK